MLLLPTEHNLNNFFIDESSIESSIQRIYSLPIPYSTQCPVNVDSYTASLTSYVGSTPVRTTGDGNRLWNAISNCLCGNEKYTYFVFT